jgi:hypothetical protein
MHNPFLTRQYHALLDAPSGALLTVGTSFPAAVFLNECTPDTSWASQVQHPSYVESFALFFIASVKPEEYPRWSWDRKTRKFIKTPSELLGDALMDKSRLAESKRGIFEIMVTELNFARAQISTGVWFQETVYLAKRMQAAAFRDSGYDEDAVAEYPFVVQYADQAHISLREAADDILLKAKFDEGILAKTELLRLTHFNNLKKVRTLDELPPVHEAFIRDAYLNAKI